MTIRVAHVVNSTFGAVFSGQTHYLFSLLSGWKEKEVSLDLYGTPIKPLNMNSGDRAYRLPEGSLWSANSKTQSRWERIRWSLALLWMLVRRRKEYDIVHFHALGWGVFLSPLVLHPLGKKIVFTMSLFGNDNPSYILQRPRGRFQVNLLRRFDGFIGLSPALVEDAIANGFCNVMRLTNFMAIDQMEQGPNLFHRIAKRNELLIPDDAVVLLYVGVAHRRKGLDLLVNAFIDLCERHDNVWLIIIGPRNKDENPYLDDEIMPQIFQRITCANLQNKVRWTGLVTNLNEIASYYWASDIFILPTHNEGSPNVIAEAIYAKLPIVVSDLPGITDSVVSNNENGFLVPVDNLRDLIDKIEQLIVNPELRRALGENGRQKAAEIFGFEQYCNKLKNFYIDLAQKENQDGNRKHE